MNMLTPLSNRSRVLGLFLGATVMLNASSVYADNCGSGERAAMPQCSRFVSLGSEGAVEVYNLCSEKVTVKLAVTGSSDKLIDLKPGYGAAVNVGTSKKLNGMAYEQINSPTEASCCPKYSKCTFSNEKELNDSAPDAWSRAQAAKQDSRFKGMQ